MMFFFLQGRQDYSIEQFLIYDRWGNQLYERRGGRVNHKEYGWDGTSGGESMGAGVYVWLAKVRAMDQSLRELAGDVFLSR